MAVATISAVSQILLSGGPTSRSFSRLSPFHLNLPGHQRTIFSAKQLQEPQRHGYAVIECAAVDTTATEVETKKQSSFELQTLTTWLLKQEQAGNIDSELTIVLSSISMACKQIASLVQRANISNLTGVQGAVNVQGEDQKKLDVVSNEVGLYYYSFAC